MNLISGKLVAKAVLSDLAQEVQKLNNVNKRPPHLAAILVGNDGGSESYVANKIKACQQVGFHSTLIRFPDTVSETTLLQKIQELNNKPEIDGFIVQLPLPKHINVDCVIATIKPEKDVDGFHPINIGKTALGQLGMLPATPHGIITLLAHYNIETQGKHCVVVGRSNIVGMPMSLLMMQPRKYGNCTVTVCHSRTKDLKQHTLLADILIAAIGKPGFITADMVKPGAVVIDVGTTRVTNNDIERGWQLKGDVAFDEVSQLASAITPVPGGVGPMTIAMLLKNTLIAYKTIHER